MTSKSIIQIFIGYRFVFWPKIEGTKNSIFSKVIALLFGLKSRGPRIPCFPRL